MTTHQICPQTQLEVRGYFTRVYLGCSDEERSFPQEVEFDLRVRFLDGIRATHSDQLDDTVNYASLCELIEQVATAQPYRLIEAVGGKLYDAALLFLKDHHVAVQVAIHKIHPPVEKLRGRATFIYGDPLA